MKREFDRKIWKSGNSYVITVPAETVERYSLNNKFVTVAISDESDSIINNNNIDKQKNKSKSDYDKDKNEVKND